MRIKLASFTIRGGGLCARLRDALDRLGHAAEGYCKKAVAGTGQMNCSIGEFAQRAFSQCDALVFIGAAGIAVRAVAPLLHSKQTDPAVVVVDETGKFVIPILSGHIGGANELAQSIAGILGAQPVITTATDCNGLFAVDTWAVKNGCHIANVDEVRAISAALLNGDKVGFYSEFPVEGELPEGLTLSRTAKVGISVSAQKKQLFAHTLHLIPRRYVVGIGCRKNTAYEKLNGFVHACLAECGIAPYEVGSMASIDLKSEEEGIVRLAREFRVPFLTYSAAELSAVSGVFTGSVFVETATGVDNVCERAAIKASGGKLVLHKTCREGMTAAIAQKEWRCGF